MELIIFLKRLSCTKSLVRTPGHTGWVYMVINRPKRTIVQLIGERRAAELLAEDGEKIPRADHKIAAATLMQKEC